MRTESDGVASGTRPLVAFNARSMPVAAIVESFAEPIEFERLRRPVNSLLSGPRGSGKTTMMKMLQPAALELWNTEGALHASSEIPYTGVFIATDRAWKRQIRPKLVDDNPFGPEIDTVAAAAFTTHVLRELTAAMRFRLSLPSQGLVKRPRVVLSDPEDRLAMSLARVAHFTEFEPSLKGVWEALTVRMSHLREITKSLKEGRNFPIPDWVQVECIGAVCVFVDLFNDAVRDDQHQWALLFDEMELAPTSIVESLLDAMRGLPQNLLLKLSLSPVQPELSALHVPYAAVDGQDFELIRLSYPHQAASIDIGSRMLRESCGRRGLEVRDIAGILGRSVFASGDDGGGGRDRLDNSQSGNPYARNSTLWKKYKRLEKSDPSFSAWLSKNNVQLDGLESLSPVMRAAKLRKIRNLVVVREHYLREENRRRSRKSYELYTGADTLLLLCDGNARMLTALLGELVAVVNPETRRIDVPVQSLAIDHIIRRFFALIDSSEAVKAPSGEIATLNQLIQRIGDEFARHVISDPFSDNMALSFTVDKRVTRSTITLLQVGINVGAFVHVPKKSDTLIPIDLVGEQFRLSYVLAPYFGLPVRLGRAINLSTLLVRGSRTRQRDIIPRTANADVGQLSLFVHSQKVRQN
ncbi:hypothetical protein ACLTEW_06735 [Gordonia lacunae]|uniref:ORC-CDC6 family AAA ATPase n=1 Tax=Gordonia lacunae TaxID=417102 RepID=UPI0039E25FBE